MTISMSVGVYSYAGDKLPKLRRNINEGGGESNAYTKLWSFGPKTKLNTSKWAIRSYQWIEGPKISVQAENRGQWSRPEFGRTLTEAAGLGPSCVW